MLESARILAGHYDHYILKADDNRRGRADDEIPQLMKKGLLANGVAEEAITVIADEQQAIRHGLDVGVPGMVDRLLEKLATPDGLQLTGPTPPVWVTGGDAEWLALRLRTPHRIEPWLAARGLALAVADPAGGGRS